MKEYTIDDLEKANYSVSPRSQERMVGQVAALRVIDQTDKKDMSRLKAIDRGAADTMVGDLRSDSSLETFAKQGSDDRGIIFGVSGSSEKASTEEIGELQGWVQFYPDEPERVVRLMDAGILKAEELNDIPVVEISYAKNPDSASGQIKSAVQQACLKVAQMQAFEVKGGAQDIPSMVITAYVEPSNLASIAVLERCGFDKVGEIGYDTDSESPDHLYMLNWGKLNQIVHESGDKVLFDRD